MIAVERGTAGAQGRGRAMTAMAIAAALTPLNSTMVAVALPVLGLEFGAPASSVTVWVVTAYLIATIVFQMPAGTVADRFGYARALALGRWLFAGGAVTAFLAPSLAVVIAGRLMMAAGGALMVPTVMALIRLVVPAPRRARAFGAMGAVMGGAAALGPALGGLIIARASWRLLFLVNLPLVVVSWLLQPPSFGPAGERPARPAFDWIGSVLIGATLVCFVVATRLSSPAVFVLAALSLLCAGALALQERRAAAPVLDLTLFRARAFSAGAAIIALQNLAMYALLAQVPFLFGAGSTGMNTGLGVAIMGMTASMALASPIGGRIAELVGARATVVAGGASGAAGIVLLAQLPVTATPWQIGLRLLLVGLGLGLSTGPSQAAALSAIDAGRSGMAAAALSTLRYVGAVAGTAILGLALAPGGDSLAQHHLALWVFAAAFVLSGFSALGLTASR